MVKYTILLTVLFFTATWCRYCKIMEPIVSQLQTKGYDIEIIKDDPGLFKKYGIAAFPTLMVDGVKHKGVRTKKQYKELMQ